MGSNPGYLLKSFLLYIVQVVGMPNSVDRLVHENDFLAHQFFKPFSGNNDCKKE